MRTFRKSYQKHALACDSILAKQQFMTVCVIFGSFQPEVQSFGALAQSTNCPLVRILPSDFKSLRLRARHAFGTFGEYRTRQKDYDRASASKSDYSTRSLDQKSPGRIYYFLNYTSRILLASSRILIVLHVPVLDQNVSNEYTLLYTPCSKVLSQTTLLCTPNSKVLPQESLLAIGSLSPGLGSIIKFSFYYTHDVHILHYYKIPHLP